MPCVFRAGFHRGAAASLPPPNTHADSKHDVRLQRQQRRQRGSLPTHRLQSFFLVGLYPGCSELCFSCRYLCHHHHRHIHYLLLPYFSFVTSSSSPTSFPFLVSCLLTLSNKVQPFMDNTKQGSPISQSSVFCQSTCGWT